MGRFDTRVNMQEAVEAFAKQARSGEEHNRHGQFEDDKVRAEATPEGT